MIEIPVIAEFANRLDCPECGVVLRYTTLPPELGMDPGNCLRCDTKEFKRLRKTWKLEDL